MYLNYKGKDQTAHHLAAIVEKILRKEQDPNNNNNNNMITLNNPPSYSGGEMDPTTNQVDNIQDPEIVANRADEGKASPIPINMPKGTPDERETSSKPPETGATSEQVRNNSDPMIPLRKEEEAIKTPVVDMMEVINTSDDGDKTDPPRNLLATSSDSGVSCDPEKNNGQILNCQGDMTVPLPRISYRQKKTPITKTDDFLW
jgi:hypothetical protein